MRATTATVRVPAREVARGMWIDDDGTPRRVRDIARCDVSNLRERGRKGREFYFADGSHRLIRVHGNALVNVFTA